MLYQEIRPKKFEDIVGNKSAVTSLTKLFSSDKRPHAFLLTGPSGCGKTTLARIIANVVECEGIDLQEINSASERGIDVVRELAKSSNYAPMSGKNRVIVLDEVHATTPQAMQSMLKLLEDIPEYQYYILISTDPQKILTTIKNRCAIYSVSKLRRNNMMELLNRTIESLGKKVDEDVLELIVLASEGSPRQALMLLEQVIDLDTEDALDTIQSCSVYEYGVVDLCKEMVSTVKDDKRPLTLLKILSSLEMEPEKTKRAILGYLNAQLVRTKSVQKAARLVEIISEILGADTMYGGDAALSAAIFSISILEI